MPLGMQTVDVSKDEDLKSLLIESGILSEESSRQVRRAEFRSARAEINKRFGVAVVPRDAAKRALGWLPPEEAESKRRMSGTSGMAALGMLAALGRSRGRFMVR